MIRSLQQARVDLKTYSSMQLISPWSCLPWIIRISSLPLRGSGAKMNTRTVIIFLPEGVLFINEYMLAHRQIFTGAARSYPYENMTTASFLRLVRLSKCNNASIRLQAYTSIKRVNTMIYWKREHGRLYNGNPK